jgi:predicted Fe-S protein YdhL (DUF1289 family)
VSGERQTRSDERRDDMTTTTAAGRKSGAGADHVPSPCVSICTMDAASGLCLGCWRTLDEIAAWSVLDAGAKRAVLAALPARRAAQGAPAPGVADADH